MNKYQKEYIGKKVKITKSKNKQHENLEGVIVDETKHTFKVKGDKIRTILKKGNEFLIGSDRIEGDKITKKPEERIKIRA